jgi:TPR repeat protein
MQFMFKVVIVLLLSFQAAQASLSKGLAAAQAGDFATAYELWLPVAEQGDAAAQFNLGLLHSKELIPQASPEDAVKWYLLAANNDHVNAQFNLGLKYDKGIGVEQSEAEAFRWYFKAANNGHPQAQFNVANMYRDGRGVEHSNEQAATWYQASSINNIPQAQANLALLYSLGTGIEQDMMMAYVWATIASEADTRFIAIKELVAEGLSDNDKKMGDEKALEVAERLTEFNNR